MGKIIDIKMAKLLLTCSCILIAVFSFAQKYGIYKISGTIISANSGEPIPDGIIMVSRTKGFKCDSLGNFTIYNLTSGQHKLSFSALGYTNKDTAININDSDINNLRWVIYSNCLNYSKEAALNDIRSNNMTILFQSGIAPIVYSKDKDFQEKYNVAFLDFGCVVSENEECLKAYNRTIFEYLDKKYGKKWRSEIRKDAIGLKYKFIK